MNDSISKRRLLQELQQSTPQPSSSTSSTSNGMFHLWCPSPQTDLYTWMALLYGPKDTAYQGQHFTLLIKCTQNYPFDAPVVCFTPCPHPIPFHPNIDPSTGAICLDLLKGPSNGHSTGSSGSWKPTLSLNVVVKSIWLLLAEEPNVNDPLDMEAATLYKMDRTAYHQRIKQQLQADIN